MRPRITVNNGETQLTSIPTANNNIKMTNIINIEIYYYIKLVTIIFDKSVVLSSIVQVQN